MRTRYLSETGNRLLLLAGQIVVLLICFIYLEHVYIKNILPDKTAKDSFVQTQCLLLDKKLSSKGRLLSQYRADFLIAYNINDVAYQRWVSGNGLDNSWARTRANQELLLSQYQVNANYDCWYNPAYPSIAILVMRHNWLSTLPLILPSIISVITLYYLLKNISLLLAAIKYKAKEIVKDKETRKKK